MEEKRNQNQVSQAAGENSIYFSHPISHMHFKNYTPILYYICISKITTTWPRKKLFKVLYNAWTALTNRSNVPKVVTKGRKTNSGSPWIILKKELEPLLKHKRPMLLTPLFQLLSELFCFGNTHCMLWRFTHSTARICSREHSKCTPCQYSLHWQCHSNF